MRRTFIYPHRSVRSIRIGPSRIVAGTLAAAVLSSILAAWGTRLLDFHQRITFRLLQLAGVQSLNSQSIEIFPGFGPATAPVLAVPSYKENPWLPVILFLLVALAFSAIYWLNPLSRNFTFFLMTLLVLSAVAIAANWMPALDSVSFTQIWLRGEVLIWLILPWISGFILILPHPSLARGFLWMLLLEAYGFLWSAVRLTFCLGLLQVTGTLFLPLMWFSLGMLATLLYVVFFYSIVLYQISGMWGRRRSWLY